MKKLISTPMKLLTLILFFTLAGCGESQAFYPKEELRADGLDTEKLAYFNQVFFKVEDFMFDDYAIKLSTHGSDFFATLYGLDATGKAMNSYDIQGDLFKDIISGIYMGNESALGYTYSFTVEESEDGNTITGSHVIFDDILKNQDYNELKKFKDDLTEAGYPYETIYYLADEDVLHYGKFIISGDMKENILSLLYGKLYLANEKYSFSQEKGVIYTERINEG